MPIGPRWQSAQLRSIALVPLRGSYSLRWPVTVAPLGGQRFYPAEFEPARMMLLPSSAPRLLPNFIAALTRRSAHAPPVLPQAQLGRAIPATVRCSGCHCAGFPNGRFRDFSRKHLVSSVPAAPGAHGAATGARRIHASRASARQPHLTKLLDRLPQLAVGELSRKQVWRRPSPRLPAGTAPERASFRADRRGGPADRSARA